MLVARNNVEVDGFPNYQSSGTFLLDPDTVAFKVSVHVKKNPVVLQITENTQQNFENAYDTEIELPIGFHSIAFVTPITGIRFRRGAGGEPAAVNFRMYG